MKGITYQYKQYNIIGKFNESLLTNFVAIRQRPPAVQISPGYYKFLDWDHYKEMTPVLHLHPIDYQIIFLKTVYQSMINHEL